MLQIKPLHLREANAFVNAYHRHNLPTAGGKFAVGCYVNETLCGVAICGRPTARNADNGTTLEIYRNCTDGTKNACSKLYGACVRIAKEMGYTKVITYILESENGASVKASNFICEGKAGLNTVCVECGKPIAPDEGCIWTKQRGYPPTFIHLKCYEKLLPKNRGKADGTPT